MKLTVEEKEDLEDMLAHPGMKVLWKAAESAFVTFNEQVVRYNLETGNLDEMGRIKCRAEGAAQLLNALKQRLQSKPPTKKRLAT